MSTKSAWVSFHQRYRSSVSPLVRPVQPVWWMGYYWEAIVAPIHHSHSFVLAVTGPELMTWINSEYNHLNINGPIMVTTTFFNTIQLLCIVTELVQDLKYVCLLGILIKVIHKCYMDRTYISSNYYLQKLNKKEI